MCEACEEEEVSGWVDAMKGLLEAQAAMQREIEKLHDLVMAQHDLQERRYELLDKRLSQLEGERERLQ